MVTTKLDLLESNVLNNAADRIRRYLVKKGIFDAAFIRVPKNYYEFGLVDRARLIERCCGICAISSQLCKSIIFENTSWLSDTDNEFRTIDSTNAKYYCVIVQYEAKFVAEMLRDVIWQLRQSDFRLSKKKFHFQLAPEEVTRRLTGFLFNGVSPVGMLCQLSVPVVICSRIVENPQLRSIYLGGGEVDLKLRITVTDLVSATNAIVGRISVPRIIGSEDSRVDEY